ncbi:MAG TPA: CPBP family intramembrane glutamic endopeptidase [Acidimicrobiales bacterium]|nr:CPBP family intramembrane glutamic endopeptidase [Acidimicrobiales bacterium]
MDTCGSCGAALYNATYCGQCFAPVEHATRPRPERFAPRFAGSEASPPVAAFPAAVLVEAPPAPPPPPAPAPPPPEPLVASLSLPTAPTPVKAEGRVLGTLGIVLALGLLFQLATAAYGQLTDAEPHSVIRTGLYLTLAFYAVVLVVVVTMGRSISYLPLWRGGSTAEDVGIGVFAGVGTAGALLYGVKLLTGRITVSPDVKFIAGDVTVAGVLVAAAVLVVAAPVVEELLFRGFAAEALRRHGRVVALSVSGVAFALWHMRLGAVVLVYYTAMGAILGLVYWRRGLVGSMAAHAAFNGTLLLVAITFILGPGETLTAERVQVRVPGGWQAVEDGSVQGATLAAHGPSAAVFYVVHETLPVADVPLEMLLQSMQATGSVGLAGVSVRPGTARIVEYPEGRAIRMELEAGGKAGEFALFVEGTDGWTVALEHGTDRTRADFEEMLRSLRLG